MDFTFKMSDAFENMAISSTFTLVSLVNYKEEHYSWEKKYVFSIFLCFLCFLCLNVLYYLLKRFCISIVYYLLKIFS